jgi:hypothetical protein
MFCQSANQSLGTEKEVEKGMQSVIHLNYSPLVERLIEVGILEERIIISSSKTVGPLLLRLDKEFRSSPDVSNKKKQAIFIWAFQEYLGREVAF